MTTWEDSVGTMSMEPRELRRVTGWVRRMGGKALAKMGFVPCATCGRLISQKQAYFDFGECRECAMVTKTYDFVIGAMGWSQDAIERARSEAFWNRELKDIKVA
jgi:hypothetical protein